MVPWLSSQKKECGMEQGAGQGLLRQRGQGMG